MPVKLLSEDRWVCCSRQSLPGPQEADESRWKDSKFWGMNSPSQKALAIAQTAFAEADKRSGLSE